MIAAVGAFAAAAGTSEIYVDTAIITAVPGPEPTIGLWLGFAAGAFVLLVVLAHAIWRGSRFEQVPSGRSRRIFRASLTCAGAWTLMVAPQRFIESGALYAPPFGETLLFGCLIMLVIALALVGTADMLLDYFRPKRTPFWAIVAPSLFTAFIVGLFSASDLLDSAIALRQDPWRLMLAAAVLAAGLTWWSYLPGENEQVARVFD